MKAVCFCSDDLDSTVYWAQSLYYATYFLALDNANYLIYIIFQYSFCYQSSLCNLAFLIFWDISHGFTPQFNSVQV